MRRREFLAGAAASSVLLPSAAEAMLGTRRVALLGRPAVSYDAAAQAIFDAFTTPPTTARKAVINTCVVALKAAGVWTLLDCLYLMAAADNQAARINWKMPASFTLSAINSPTFTADRGFTGDGASTYLDTNYTPSTNAVALSLNSAHYGGWALNSLAAGSANRLVGNVASTGTGRSLVLPRNTGDIISSLANDTSGTTLSNATTSGFFVVNRSGASARQAYRNGSSLGSDATAAVALPNQKVAFLRDTTSFATLQVAVGTIGASLTAQQASDFHAAILAYLQAVGAQ
jgi:hypothetical protein